MGEYSSPIQLVTKYYMDLCAACLYSQKLIYGLQFNMRLLHHIRTEVIFCSLIQKIPIGT